MSKLVTNFLYSITNFRVMYIGHCMGTQWAVQSTGTVHACHSVVGGTVVSTGKTLYLYLFLLKTALW